MPIVSGSRPTFSCSPPRSSRRKPAGSVSPPGARRREEGPDAAESIPWGSSSYISTLRGVGLPTGGLDVELLCVLGVQSLPAAELDGIGADDASHRFTGEEPLEDVEADVPA